MKLEINLVEAVWIALNLSITVLTASALADAWSDRSAIRKLNGHARELVAGSIIRREFFRLIIQALLLLAVVPGLFVANEAMLNPTILALMAVPVVLFGNSALDARDRKRMTILVAADILEESKAAMARLEDAVASNKAAIAENTQLTMKAANRADDVQRAAEVMAPTVAHTAEQVDDIHRATVEAVAHLEDTAEHTATQVEDIHEAIVDKDDTT